MTYGASSDHSRPAGLAARGSGARSFVLWTDEHHRERVATLVTLSATGGVATFHGAVMTRRVRQQRQTGTMPPP
ncbi:hypothetical protein [Streptomyces sp. NPDC127098]|uniref:hypothetical protein n=1 Tax=Streptomyces sp. NPDC127098 TaxID=3347137 RepID=UPI00364662ED